MTVLIDARMNRLLDLYQILQVWGTGSDHRGHGAMNLQEVSDRLTQA